VVIVAIVVVLALLAGAVGLVLTRDEGGEDAAAATTTTTTEESTTTTEEPTTTTESDAGSSDEEFVALVRELQAFVEDERGLEFVEDVQVDLADDDEFEARLLEDFAEDEADLREDERVFKALGLLEPDVDLVEALRELLSVGVIGFYDPETGELVVRGTDTSPYVQRTIVHELTHALDDQHFELDRPEIDEAVTEIGFGFSSLVEGNASVVESAWEAELSEDEQDAIFEEELQSSFGLDPNIPLVLLELLVAPYEEGEPLVDTILDEAGQERLDAAFAVPPLTSKEVLDPDLFLEGFVARSVTKPPADGDEFDEGAFGQLTLELLLDQAGVGDGADGWGGDWYVAWDNPDGTTCVRADFAGVTSDDTAELGEALSDWAQTQPQASIEDLPDDLVRLTACTTSSTGGGGLS
jgi:hypothetical protein